MGRKVALDFEEQNNESFAAMRSSGIVPIELLLSADGYEKVKDLATKLGGHILHNIGRAYLIEILTDDAENLQKAMAAAARNTKVVERAVPNVQPEPFLPR